MELIIEKLASEAKTSKYEVERLIEEISSSLVKEGCGRDEPRFMQYLVRRLRKRLKIEESKIYKSFRQFFQR